MGWSGGSGLMVDIIKATKKTFNDDKLRYQFYKIIIDKFENYDADTLDEACGVDEAYDKAFAEHM